MPLRPHVEFKPLPPLGEQGSVTPRFYEGFAIRCGCWMSKEGEEVELKCEVDGNCIYTRMSS